MSYVFVADDFTGASDTLATLARGGMRTRLFLDVPDAGQVEGLDAWGVATEARSLDTEPMTALAKRIGASLSGFMPQFLHVKICSTFDSSTSIGNIALLALGLADATGINKIAVIGGQPTLGRYAVFGNLFAKAPDDHVHRIDRHPVMATHPVTPMKEGDIILHLAQLGLHGLSRVGRGQRGGAFPRFYDILDQADVSAAGRDLTVLAQPCVILGASSVAEAWLATQPAREAHKPSAIAATAPLVIFAGSRSSLTTSQIAATEETARLPLNPQDLMEGQTAFHHALTWSAERVQGGQDCLIYLTAENSGAIAPAALAQRSAELVARIVTLKIGGLIVAGGDTSSAIVRQLAPLWLDHAGEVCPGVPVLQSRTDAGDLPLILKGGQMGQLDFFQQAATALRSQ